MSDKCKLGSHQVKPFLSFSFITVLFLKKRFIIEKKVNVNARNRLGCTGKIKKKKKKKNKKK